FFVRHTRWLGDLLQQKLLFSFDLGLPTSCGLSLLCLGERKLLHHLFSTGQHFRQFFLGRCHRSFLNKLGRLESPMKRCLLIRYEGANSSSPSPVTWICSRCCLDRTRWKGHATLGATRKPGTHVTPIV